MLPVNWLPNNNFWGPLIAIEIGFGFVIVIYMHIANTERTKTAQAISKREQESTRELLKNMAGVITAMNRGNPPKQHGTNDWRRNDEPHA